MFGYVYLCTFQNFKNDIERINFIAFNIPQALIHIIIFTLCYSGFVIILGHSILLKNTVQKKIKNYVQESNIKKVSWKFIVNILKANYFYLSLTTTSFCLMLFH